MNYVVCMNLSRCGMIYMEPHQLGWAPLRDSYMNTLPKSLEQEHRELVRSNICPVCHSVSCDNRI